MPKSKRGAKVAAVYFAVVAVAAVPVLLKAGKLAGVYVFAATFPWSMAFALGLDMWDPSFLDRWYAGLIAVGLSAVINGAILYGITAWVERSRHARQ